MANIFEWFKKPDKADINYSADPNFPASQIPWYYKQSKAVQWLSKKWWLVLVIIGVFYYSNRKNK